MRVADVKLSWNKSVSADVTKVVVSITNNGVEQTAELGPEVEDFMIEVNAGGTVQYSVTTFDDDDNETTSTTYTFTISDLVPPQPATDLFHEIVGVRDVPDPAPMAARKSS